MTRSFPMPVHRGLTLTTILALCLGLLLPLVAAAPVGAVSSDIVISEFQVRGAAGAGDEFVEIHNRSSAPVDIGGWTLRRSTGTGNPATHLTFSAGTTINPGCFLLLTNAGYDGPVSGNIIYSTGIVDNGGLAVVNGSDVVVDAVGFGAISFYFEGTVLPTLTDDVDQSRERLPGGAAGHADTDNNAADFQLLNPPNPQNASSTCIDYGEGTAPTGVGSADPASVMPGEETTLSVAVTPGTEPASTGITVTGDLSAIGGSATQAFDDTDGDLTFTFTITVAAGTTPGAASLPFTVADAEGRSSAGSIGLTVTAEPTEIWEIQGAAHTSPMVGEAVFGVEGVVTARRSNSFWMTDPTPDDDPATSDGILVFGATATVGDLVAVDGTVVEFSAGPLNLTTTEIGSPTVTVVSSGHELPTTVVGEDVFPPTLVIDDDSTSSVHAADAVFDPANDGIDFWESLEGMRLQVADAVAVGPRNGFGEIAVVSENQDDAGIRTPRGGILVRKLGAAGDYRPGDFNPERLILDDVIASTPQVNAGDAFATDPVGVLDYSFGNFKLLVTATPARVDNGLAPEVTAAAGPHDLAVATFNVENLAAVDTDAKVNALASQIVNNLRSPDLIAIEEMRDNNGGTNNGVVAADLSWQRLIDAIVAAGGPLYDYRQIDPVNNADGGAPGGNIRVGFLFHSERGLEFVDRPGGDAVTDTDVIANPSDKGAQLTISPGRVLPDPTGPWATAFDLTRKSLAGEFRWRGETVFVVANHFSSKGDDRPLFGHFQPPFRLTEFESQTDGVEDGWRHAQAQVINDFVDEILAVDDGAHVIVLGDINDFDFSETVEIVTGERMALDPGPFMPDPDGSGQTAATGADPIMRTLFDLLPENERYSYVFDGNSQVLDQILVSGSLWDLGTTYDVVHVNAEFAQQASDHDPSVMRVAFQPRSSDSPTATKKSR